MDEKRILSHCAIVKAIKCENEKYWYNGCVGEHFVAFGFDKDEQLIYCCHKRNNRNTIATLPLNHAKIIQGDLYKLYDYS